MLRFVVSNQRLLARLLRLGVSRKLFRVDLRAIPGFDEDELIDYGFTEIGMRSGVTKQTRANRFLDLDQYALGLIRRSGAKSIHDVGVSSGVTSVELLDRLREGGFTGRFTVSDKYSTFYAAPLSLGTAIYDADRNLYCRYLLGICGHREDSWKFPLSKLLYSRAPAVCPADAEPFALFHPALMARIRDGRAVHVDYDVFSSRLEGRFDFVRCMNLLNRGYFSESELLQGVDNLKRSLVAGGTLQIGRTLPDGTNHAGFYELDDRLRPVAEFGGGSEIHDIICRA